MPGSYGSSIAAGTPLPQYNYSLRFCGSAPQDAMLCGNMLLPQFSEFCWFCGSAVPGAICCGVATK